VAHSRRADWAAVCKGFLIVAQQAGISTLLVLIICGECWQKVTHDTREVGADGSRESNNCGMNGRTIMAGVRF